MITAVDSSILLDIFIADPRHGPASGNAIAVALRKGRLVVCDVVWAETRAHFHSEDEFNAAMRALGATFDPMKQEGCALAGALWKNHRRRGGRARRVVADFLIGAHAISQADVLLSRDRGFYRTYFSKLNLIEPSMA